MLTWFLERLGFAPRRAAQPRLVRRPRPAPPVRPDDEKELPARHDGLGNLDAARITPIRKRDSELMDRIAVRIETRDFSLPKLPSTHMTVMDLAANPKVQVEDIVQALSRDLVLSSEILKTSNSVLMGAHTPADTLHDAVMRLGMRSLRSMILSMSMRGALLRDPAIELYAKEVWRQSTSVAKLARVIGTAIKIDPEHAFLLGLMHDIGKVALLAILAEEISSTHQLSSALIGDAFRRFHEQAGVAMAESWQLTEELISVAGCHHNIRTNKDHPRAAALVCLAHKMDLFLTMGSEDGFQSLMDSDEMEFLELSHEARVRLLTRAELEFTTSAALNAA